MKKLAGIRVPDALGRRGVMFLWPEVFKRPGGIQNVCRDQVQSLRRIQPRVPLRALVLNDAPEDVGGEEWEGVFAKGFSGNKARFALVALQGAAQMRPAMLMLGHRGLLPLAPFIKLLTPRTSLGLMIHGMDAWPKLGRIERVALRSVSRVFSVSPNTGAQFHAAGFLEQVELLPNGLPHFWLIGATVSPRFEVPIRLLAVARLWASEKLKGIDHTLEALALMSKRGVEVRYDVAGTGDDLKRLANLADSLGVRDSVRFHGRVSDAELAALYKGADIFVLPSGSEGFGIVFLEAMAYAKPVVAADAAGAPFVVRPRVSGCLVPYGSPQALSECLMSLIKDPQGARELGLAGRKFLEDNFTFKHYQRRFLKVLGLDAISTQ